jgi:hypothetical protein
LIEKHALDLRKTLRKSPAVVVVIGISNAKVGIEKLPTYKPELRYRFVDSHRDTSLLNIGVSLPHVTNDRFEAGISRPSLTGVGRPSPDVEP